MPIALITTVVTEMLMGGTGQSTTRPEREITEIEQSILDGVLRIILNDLRTAWQAVATIDFEIESHETEPQLLQILAPNEAVVAISMEIRIGEMAGIMNLGIPSITVKMLRQKFDQQWSVRKTRATEDEHARVLHQRRRPIPGLYATGVASARTELGAGYQAGLNMASGLTFGMLAAEHMSRSG